MLEAVALFSVEQRVKLNVLKYIYIGGGKEDPEMREE